MTIINKFIAIQGAVSRTTAKLIKTGQTISYRTGDDGDTQRGRLSDFWTLDEVNPFNNTYRFTGTTGGYQDHLTTLYYDVNNNITNEAGAFPEGVRIDWGFYGGGVVLGWAKDGFLSGGTFDSFVAHCVAYTTILYPTGWAAPNINEYISLVDYSTLPLLEVVPFNITAATRIISGSTDMFDASNCQFMSRGVKRTSVYSKSIYSGSNCILPVREFTVTGTILT